MHENMSAPPNEVGKHGLPIHGVHRRGPVTGDHTRLLSCAPRRPSLTKTAAHPGGASREDAPGEPRDRVFSRPAEPRDQGGATAGRPYKGATAGAGRHPVFTR